MTAMLPNSGLLAVLLMLVVANPQSTGAGAAAVWLRSVSAARLGADTTGQQDDGNPDQPNDLDVILRNWTTVGAAVETLEARFVRQEFDGTREIESRMVGRVHYESSGSGLYAIEPPSDLQRQRSGRTNRSGRPYQLQAVAAETLYWVHGQFLKINPVRREYELMEVPEPFLKLEPVKTLNSWDVIWTRIGSVQRSLPGLVEPDLAALQQRFEWSLLNYDEERIILIGKALSDGEKQTCSELQVVLNAKTYLPLATKMIDPSGLKEVVHVFSDVKANAPQTAASTNWAPDLARYRLLTAPPLAPPSVEDE
jgi:hypothetical protein